MSEYYYTALGDSITSESTSYMFNGFSYQLYKYLEKCHDGVIFKNLAKPSLTSHGLLMQIRKSTAVRNSIKKADIITITIGGNNLLKGTVNNYTNINKEISEAGVNRFKKDWPVILSYIRGPIASHADIYVLTLYNPFLYSDPNYKLADHYIGKINSIIKNPILVNAYRYKVVDIYDDFESRQGKTWTFFNTMLRDPHPNLQGHLQIAKAFINSISST
ncbi:MAG: GDSL-type esterase/lipase family protein [Bacillota bacterium]|nr:GDSL-type esterase/lipase family protein [Bacillota bacterium]